MLQQWVRDQIVSKLHLQTDDVRSTSMGCGGEDVLLSPTAREKANISIECKSRQKVAVYGFYEQASTNCRGAEPVVIVKQNRSKPLAIVDAEYYFKLLGKVNH
jgi:hypothetical protein